VNISDFGELVRQLSLKGLVTISVDKFDEFNDLMSRLRSEPKLAAQVTAILSGPSRRLFWSLIQGGASVTGQSLYNGFVELRLNGSAGNAANHEERSNGDQDDAPELPSAESAGDDEPY
jgi:hypothetical protein